MTRILFSPIGTNDPYSNREKGAEGANMEGSALAVFRAISPDIVYLFYNKSASGSMDIQAKDTADAIAQEFPDVGLVGLGQDGFCEPHIYDSVYPLIDSCLNTIRQENPSAELILNASSGTPAIKAALMIIHTLDKYDTVTYQVSDRGDSRVTKIEKYHSLSNEITRENIKTLINEYDYNAAQALIKARTNGAAEAVLNTEVTMLIEGAAHRYELRTCKARDCLGKESAQTLLGSTSRTGKAFEYLQYLKLLAHKEEWAAFLRATDPALICVLLCAVDAFTNYDARQLVNTDDSTTLNVTLVTRDEVLSEVFGRDLAANTAQDRYITWHPLLTLLKEHSKDIPKNLLLKLEKIYSLQQLRNRFVHSVQRVDENAIRGNVEKWLGLFEPLLEASAKKKGEHLPPWDSYDQINAAIIEQL